MRIKGGGHGKIRREIVDFAEMVHGRTLAKIIDRILDGKVLSSLGFALVAFNPFAGLGWLLGVAPSIGEEIGAIGGYRGHWNYNDRDSWFLSKYVGFRNIRVWGAVSGLLRGLFMGLCLAITTLNPWFILAGASFPLAYFIGVSIRQRYERLIAVDWHLGEWIYGLILGIPLIC